MAMCLPYARQQIALETGSNIGNFAGRLHAHLFLQICSRKHVDTLQKRGTFSFHVGPQRRSVQAFGLLTPEAQTKFTILEAETRSHDVPAERWPE